MAELGAKAGGPRISLILPCRNEEASVETTLNSVLAGELVPDEVIVADGRSTDMTRYAIEEFAARHPELTIKVVDNEKLWAGSARNRAIEQSAGDLILAADFGNALRPNWAKEMVRPFLEDASVDVVAGLYQPQVESDFQHCVAVVHMFDDYTLHLVPEEERQMLLPEAIVPVGLAVAMTKETWQDIGGFPEWLFKGQDKLFGRKAWAMRKKIVVAWHALVDHHVRSSPKELFWHQYYYGRGFGQQRLVSGMARRMAIVYTLFVFLAVVGLAWWPAWWCAVALFGAYVWHFGFRKLWRQNLRPWSARYLWMIPAALIARDTGSIFGHIVGWAHWLTRPGLRKMHRDYLQDVDASRLRIVSR